METNAIYEGDNLEIMSKFPDKCVDLIYADPPFFTNKNYEVIWHDKEEIRSFKDRWEGGIEFYITWMEPRLRECYRVLKDTGSMYLHCDYHANAHLRILMDKIFGGAFRNEIVWSNETSSGFKAQANKWIRGHDTILFYSKSSKYIFNRQHTQLDVRTINRYDKTDKDGRKYKIYFEKDGSKRIVYLDKSKGKAMSTVWSDIPSFQTVNNTGEYMGYPTQKPVALLERIIISSSNKESVVLDPFCGCGTTLMASQKLGRKWVGIDISPTACKLMAKRLKKEYSISAQLIKGDVDINYVKKLPPFEFQNWVVVDKFLGTISRTKSGDMGIDGLTPQVTGGYPIQVKQSEDIGRNPIDNFETAMRRTEKKKGYFVAFSFGSGAKEEVARLKNQEGVEIVLRTVQELLDRKTE